MKPFKYDSSKNTQPEDVKKEAAEAVTEAKEAAAAVVDAVTGDGTLAEVGKQLGEAVEAASEAAEAAVDLVGDKVIGWFRTKLGYQLHDGSQNVTIKPDGEGTKAEMTEWMQVQIKAGLIERVQPPSK